MMNENKRARLLKRVLHSFYLSLPVILVFIFVFTKKASMKKITFLLFAAAVSLLFTSACRKEKNGITITKVINVVINANETYSTEIPHSGDADDAMQITVPAAHALVSKLTSASGGNSLFEYTPVVNYTGSDEVIVSNQEERHGNGGHGNCGGGNHHHDDNVIYDFKITIQGTAHRSGL
jgi:hypothetical protein